MARIPEDKIDEIRTSVNIVHYIQQFVNLKKAGQNFKGLCPFHTEKTPSFVVSPEKQIFRCFGCGKGGNVFTFITDFEKLNFLESVQKAADFAGISLPKPEVNEEETGYFQTVYMINEIACSFFEDNLWNGKYKKYLKYFLDRKISEQTIKTFRLGFAPDSYEKLLPKLKEQKVSLEETAKLGLIQKSEKTGGYYDKFRLRVIFPFHNVSGKVIGFGGRKMEEQQQPKYLNSPESPVYQKGEILYGLHQAVQPIREAGHVILVEGYFDLLRLVESGFKNVVAASGTAFTESQTKLLRRYTKNIHIAFDGDSAGIKAAIRSAHIIEKEGLNSFIIQLPEGDDPDTFLLKNDFSEFKKLIDQDISPMEFQVNHFLASDKSPSIEEKNNFVQDILNQLAEMPNQVKMGLYLHQLSEKLQINENLLLEQLNRFKSFRRKSVSQQQDTPAPEPVKIQSGMFKAEAGLISLLLGAGSDIRNLILNEIHIEMFENNSFAHLYEQIMQELEETGKLDAGKLLDHFRDNEEISSLISELSLIDFGDENKYSKDCIFQMKRYKLEKQAREISNFIKQESESQDSLLHYSRELIDVRRKLNDLDRSHRS